MRYRNSGCNTFPENFISIFFIFLFLLILNINCAVVPGLDTQRINEIVKGPDFAPYYGLKKRIAILDFENKTDYSGEKIGSVVADLLVSQLARSGRFILVERSQIEKILQEQALGQSGVITEESAVQVGQLLGVEALIFGKILEAGEETESHKIDDDDNKWGLALKAKMCHVRISFRVVDAATGEIIHAGNENGTEIKPGFGLKTEDFDIENMFDIDNTIMGTTIRKVVNKISLSIANNVNQIDWVGKVVQSKADTLVYFTPGRGSGVQIGQQFSIFSDNFLSTDEELSDKPENYFDSKARIKVTGFIGDKVSRAILISGQNIQRGDIVKPIKNSSKNLKQ